MDVAVVGGGPSGLVAAYYLASAGKKVALFERKLGLGGGMWGGGMMFNEIVFQSEAKEILDHFGIRSRPYKNGYFTANAIESVATICSKAAQAGAMIFNCMSVDDVMSRDGRVKGLVINWSPVEWRACRPTRPLAGREWGLFLEACSCPVEKSPKRLLHSLRGAGNG